MTTSEQTHAVRRIRGAIGPKVLAKSHELFRQDTRTLVQELFQNARRAGAASLAVEHVRGHEGGSLTIRDDGQGIADFQALLTFGDSRWEERLDLAENAAGMGFFAVASRGALVRSRGRRVSLDPAVFRGEAEACVLSDPTAPKRGTEITVPLGPGEDERIARTVAEAARHLPLAVKLDGTPVERADFLAHAEAVAEWGGVRIGVMRNDTRHWDFHRPRGNNPVNFHGVVAGFEHPGDRIVVREEDGPDWTVRFDVVDAPDLRLVLPTRDWVIVNPFARMLLGRAQRAIYAHIAAQPTHALAFKQAEAARAMGIAMPDATIRLRRWGQSAERDSEASHRVTLTGDDPLLAMVGDSLANSEVASANVTLLAEAATPDPVATVPVPMRGGAAWIGYPAYDRLARLDRLIATAVFADGTSAIVRADEGDDPEQTEAALQAMATACGHEDWTTIVAASVAITATIRERPERPGQTGVVRTWSADTGLAFTVEGDGDPMESTGLIAAADAGVGRVAEALVEHFHHPDEDRDSGSDEQQAEWARETAYARARAALLPPAEAKLRTLLDEARLERWRLHQADLAELTVTRVVQEDGTVVFRITAAALDGTHVATETA